MFHRQPRSLSRHRPTQQLHRTAHRLRGATCRPDSRRRASLNAMFPSQCMASWVSAAIVVVGCQKTPDTLAPTNDNIATKQPSDGSQTFLNHGCNTCHGGHGHGPDLHGWGTTGRLVRFLVDPDHYFGATRLEGEMTPTRMSALQLERLAVWLLSARPDDGPASHDWVKAGCGDCHNDPRSGPGDAGWAGRATGPDLRGYQSAAWTADLIADPTNPRFFGPAKNEGRAPCPPHPELSADERSAIAAWLLAGMPATVQPRAP